jgi:hypothetical protein
MGKIPATFRQAEQLLGHRDVSGGELQTTSFLGMSTPACESGTQ